MYLPHLHLSPTCLDHSPGAGGVRTVVAEDPLASRSRATWTAGDFDRIARGFTAGAAEFIAHLGVRPGERVLDVACGTGNLALPAARAGALVTGLDIAPNLLETARHAAAAEGLQVRFDEGDAEALPYPDGSFDTAVTMFGAMFAARPERAAAALARVVRPGGRIAMANWTAAGFIGHMLKAHVALVPPPAGVPSVLLWGDERAVAERLGGSVTSLSLTRRTIELVYPYSPAGTVELFQAWYGPTVRTFEALEPDTRAELRRDLVRLWTEHNLATDGTTRVASEYLEVIGIVG